MAELTCQYCSRPIAADLLICPNCGGEQAGGAQPWGLPAATVPLTGGTPHSDPPAVAPSGLVPCGSCGQQIYADATECDFCEASQSGRSTAGGTAASSAAVLVLPTGRRIPVGAEPLLLGRAEEWALAPDLATYSGVSRRHAMIVRSGDRLLLSDLGSTNGTYVNDERVDGQLPRTVRAGDRIRLGRHCPLSVEGVAGSGGVT